jgi:hypothetical protein
VPAHESFDSYRERLADSGTALLGHLVWYYVPENVRVDHEDVFKILVRAGLGLHVPRAPGDIDVFRRVSTACARNRVPTANPQVFENYLIRDLPDVKTAPIVRRVVREIVDADNRKLGYDEVAELSFDRQKGVLSCKHLLASKTADEICKQVQDDYVAERGCLNSYAIRMLILRVLQGACNAANVRYPSGGLYFVSDEYADKLDALERLGHAISAFGAQIHTIPLIDDRRQRDMLKRAFEAESVDEIDRLLTEVVDLRAAKKRISVDKYATIVTQLNDLTTKAKEYEELLETGLSSTHSRIKVFKQAVIALKGQVGK